MSLRKKKPRKLTAAVLCLLLLVLSCTPVLAASKTTSDASANGSAKVNMTKYIRYAKKGYTVIAWNQSKTKNITVYKKNNRKSGKYGVLGYGGAIIVNMDKVQRMTAGKTVKTLNWIPVFVKTSGKAKQQTGYINSSVIGFTVLDFNHLSSNSTIQKALSYGLSFLGTPYLLGGSSISTAIDCSNFVNQIYKYAGKSMPAVAHTAYLQQASYTISKEDLQAGDLLFYLTDDTSGPIGHVGVYLGEGLMIHASGHYGYNYPSGGICIKRISYGKREPARYMRLKGF